MDSRPENRYGATVVVAGGMVCELAINRTMSVFCRCQFQFGSGASAVSATTRCAPARGGKGTTRAEGSREATRYSSVAGGAGFRGITYLKIHCVATATSFCLDGQSQSGLDHG